MNPKGKSSLAQRCLFDKHPTRLIQCAREEASEISFPHQAEAPARFPTAHGAQARPTRSPTKTAERSTASHSLIELPKNPLFPPRDSRGGDLTFGRSKRLSRGKDFQRLLRVGKGLRGELLLVKALPNGLKSSRFAWSVRRAVAKDAVTRNRFKRWIREAFRCKQGKIPAGFDWIAILLKASPGNLYLIVEKEVTTLCVNVQHKFYCSE